MFEPKDVFLKLIKREAKRLGMKSKDVTLEIHGTPSGHVVYHVLGTAENKMLNKDKQTEYKLNDFLQVHEIAIATGVSLHERICNILLSLAQEYKIPFEESNIIFRKEWLDIAIHSDGGYDLDSRAEKNYAKSLIQEGIIKNSNEYKAKIMHRRRLIRMKAWQESFGIMETKYDVKLAEYMQIVWNNKLEIKSGICCLRQGIEFITYIQQDEIEEHFKKIDNDE